MIKYTCARGMVFFFKGAKSASLLFLCIFSGLKVYAQVPPNDNCSNAALILVTGNGADTGAFHGAKANLKNATLQPGESLDTLQYYMGTDKKTIWYKFTISEHRWVTIQLRQNDTAIPQNAVGMTVYKTNNCLPNLGQISPELPAISQFGNSESTCLPPGTYLIQVSSNLSANDSVWVDILVQHARNSAYDRPFEAYNFGTIISSSSLVLNIGCLSIDQPSELCPALGKNDTDYNQTAWMVFKTPTYSDLFGLDFTATDLTDDSLIFAYNLYEGDARSGPLKLISGCNVMKGVNNNGLYTFPEVFYKCNVKTNTEYTIQIFAYKYNAYPLTITLSTQGKDTAMSANPNNLPSSYQLGVLTNGTRTVKDQFACNSRMVLYPCGKDMPKYYVDSVIDNGATHDNYLRDTLDLDAWFTFTTTQTGNISFNTLMIDCQNLQISGLIYCILYSGDITKDCNAPVLKKWTYGGGSFSCFPPGTYSYQVVAVSDRHGIYNNICANYDLGKQLTTTVSFYANVAEPNAIYDTFPNADNLGDITATLATGGTVQVPLDYFGNRNVQDTIAGQVYANRILYRQFYISQRMQIEIRQVHLPTFGNNLQTQNILFQGKATDGLKSLTALPKYFQDSDVNHLNIDAYTVFRSGCVELAPGWYTMIDYYSLGCASTSVYGSQLTIQMLKLCAPQYNHPYKACKVNSGTPLDWGPNHGSATVPDYSKTYTFPQACFDCTIDTPFPFNARPCYDMAAKAPPYNRIAYYVFYLNRESFAYINITAPVGYDVSDETAFYGVYHEDIRKDSSFLGDSSKLLKPCNGFGNFCRLQPGVYTLVLYTNHINAIVPTIYLDRVVNARFDNAANAYNLGNIPPDNNIHYSPYDTISCTTGAYFNDPEVATYYASINSPQYNFFGAGKSTVPYPTPSNFNYASQGNQQYLNILRNLWYTFTATSTGNLIVTLYPGFPKTKRYNQWRITVFKDSRKGSIPFDTLISHKLVDSTLAQGLILANRSDTVGVDSFGKPDCDTDRYYVVLDYYAYINAPYLNDEVRMSVRYNGTLYGQNGDYCTNAIPMKLNGPGKASGTAVVNCHTTGESFGEDGSNLACLDIGQPYKTTWFKVTNTSSQKVDLTFNLTNNTNVPSTLIRYRILYGTCSAMTPGPCVESGYASFKLDCMSGGDYYVQVVEPVSATGNITVNAIATTVAYPVCKPFDLLKPLANFSSIGGCNVKTVKFVNLSSAGDDIRYFWDFGNGKTDTAKQPTVTYTSTKQVDTFEVKLVVTNLTNNKKDSLTLPVYLYRDPVTLTVDKSSKVICGTKLQLHATCNYKNAIYSWTPAADLDDPYIADPVATINKIDTFIITAKLTNCVVTDTIIVAIYPHVQVNNNYGLCATNQATLTGPGGFNNYTWKNGNQYYYGQQIIVTNPGIYSLIAETKSGCFGYDTTTIVKSGLFKSQLPADTVVCKAGSITLSTGVPAGQFLWSNGDTTPNIKVSQSGTYSVIIHNGNCYANDTVHVQYSTQSFSLGADTTICPGSVIVLNPDINGTGYNWSTGATTKQIFVSKQGTYTVAVTIGACSLTGTKKVYVSTFPPLSLGSPDTSFCQGLTGLLKINNLVQARYKWSTGDTTTYIKVSSAGLYSLDVHIGQCDTVLKKNVTIVPLPSPDLGRDTQICYRFEKILDAGPGDSYHWFPTGETTRWISVTHGGTYAVLVTNGSGCYKMDTIIIDTVCSDATIYVPNSFTPNKNGVNDFFKAEGTEIIAYNLQVYNRWGELIFETNDMSKGWDGKFRNQDCPMDVYIWIVNYTGARENAKVLWGNVTLLR